MSVVFILKVLVVCGLFALALLFIEAMIRFQRDCRIWNGGFCPATGHGWRVTKRKDGKVELVSGDYVAVLEGWILPFETEEF